MAVDELGTENGPRNLEKMEVEAFNWFQLKMAQMHMIRENFN